MTVEWLKPDLKQRLRQQTEGPLFRGLGPETSHGILPEKLGTPLPPSCAQTTLETLCQQKHLGMPVFLTKCLGVGPAGWHRFWYQVVIPGHPVPFSGLIWVVVTKEGPSGHEVAKNAVSLRLLEALGEPRGNESPGWRWFSC